MGYGHLGFTKVPLGISVCYFTALNSSNFGKEFLLNFGNTELWQPSKCKLINATNADALKCPHPKTQIQANLN